MASEIRLASLLDDPLFFEDAFWTDPTRNLAPLQNPSPAKYADRPYPLEPSKVIQNIRLAAKAFSTTRQSYIDERGNGLQPARFANTTIIGELSNEGTIDGGSNFPFSFQEKENNKRLRLDTKSDTMPVFLPSLSQSILNADQDSTIEPLPEVDDFVHLPQLPVRKSQKGPRLRIPPLLQGLHEPPPDAGLFPPITASGFQSFPTKNTTSLQVPTVLDSQAKPSSGNISNDWPIKAPATAVRRRVTLAKRQKWTEEETQHLLLGVERFGIGKWKKILAQPEYKFNERNAVDLKDRLVSQDALLSTKAEESVRFRTVRPEDYGISGRTDKKISQNTTRTITTTIASNLSSDTLSNLVATGCFLNDSSCTASAPSAGEATNAADGLQKLSSKRSHHHNQDDLVALGIEKAFVPSQRRDRRPFTETEDNALLAGVERHGSAWGDIRADRSLPFDSKRTPCDLRDRFRNRWPERYAKLGLRVGKVKNRKGTATIAEEAAIDLVDPASAVIEPFIAAPNSDLTPAAVSPLDTPTTTPRKHNNHFSLSNISLMPLSLITRHNDTFYDPFNNTDANVPSFSLDAEDHLEHCPASPMTPILLDRSIVDWARGLSSGMASAGTSTEAGLESVTGGGGGGSGQGIRGGVVGLPSLSFDHIPKFVDPLVTWRPAGGFH